MEDPTFPATVTSVNRRARIVAEHRPPLQIGHTGPDCRWRVEIGKREERFQELPITAIVRESLAAGFTYAPLDGELGEGLHDYAGPFRPDFVLEDLAQPVLARQLKEITLDAHLLMRAAYTSVHDRFGPEVGPEFARDEWAGIAPVSIPRIRRCLGIEGDDMASILKTLQVDPALPHDYVRFGCELLDERNGRFWIEECDALAPGEPEAWTALLEDEENPGLARVVAAVQPLARMHPIDPESVDVERACMAWDITIDPDEEPMPESPIANLVRFSNVAEFRFREDAG